jgi:cobalamin biosynthesis Mg chelatase CobN
MVSALAALTPGAAWAAGNPARTEKALGITVPASVPIHTTTTQGAAAQTTSTPASTTPTTSTPATAKPGTVAPATTTPASAPPQATTTQGTTVPTATTPTTPATATPRTPPTTGSTTAIGVARSKPQATHLSTGALALAILGALLVLGCLVWALGRWLALEPRWTVSFMHSLREASYRASATWSEFADWTRIGH